MAELSRAVAERFTLAVRELALGPGTLQERLSEAWVHTLSVQSDDLPVPLRPQFQAMEAVWLSTDASDLEDEAAEEAARAILVMQVELMTMLRPSDG